MVTAPKLSVGVKQVMLYVPDKGTTVKLTWGGLLRMLTVLMFTQPKPSITVMVVMPIGKFVATKEFPERLPGIGFHTMEIGTDADPAVVSTTEETELLQPACVTEVLIIAPEG